MGKPSPNLLRYIEVALDGEIECVRNAPQGQRNNTLFKSAAALGSLVHVGLEEQTIRDHLFEAAEANGLVADDGAASVLKTIESGMARGMANPRDIAANENRPEDGRRDSVGRDNFAASPTDVAAPVKYPAWTPKEGGKEPSCVWGGAEPPVHGGEVERYVYRRASVAERIKLKIQKAGAKSYSNWYRVHRADGEVGWQARKPIGYEEVPFLGLLDPFDVEIATGEIWWPEGEKDVISLNKIGIPAITFGGTSDLPAGCEQYVAGRDLVICADNDDPGREHAERKAWRCKSVAKSVKVIHFPDTKQGGDVTDWLAADHSENDLRQMVEAVLPWKPTKHDNNFGNSAFSASSDGAWEEPDWTILDERRGSLPLFPVGTLPKVWQDWLIRASRGAGVTPDHVAAPLLAIASSLIGTARRVQPSRSWSEPCSLWIAVIGDSGTGKTPGLAVTKRSLTYIEGSRRHLEADRRRDHETRVEAAKAAEKAWKKELEEAVAADMTPPPKPPEATIPEDYVPTRLYVSNATIERIAVLFHARPSGLLLIADELAGLFLNMSRYSKGQDNEFWLESWNGESYSVERQNRPPVLIKHLLVGMTGGFQPDKLSKSLDGDRDGMYARMLFCWPPAPEYQPLSDESAEIEPEIVNALVRLIDLPAGEEGEFVPRHVNLASMARKEFDEFRAFVHNGKDGLEGRERDWWAKGGSHVLRLAATLAFLDFAMAGEPEPIEIEARYMRSAISIWKEYFLPHSMAAIRRIGSSDEHADERYVLKWIRAVHKEQISAQDIRRDALTGRLDADKTEKLLSRLVRRGWLSELPHKGAGPGRPARRWQVNPKLFANEDAEIAENAGIEDRPQAG
jgi:hypothetical protein